MTITEFEKRATYQKGYDRVFDNWKAIDIHQIPSEFNQYHEIDFYCSNGKEVYLLRFRSRQVENYERIEAKQTGTIPYLIAELPIQKLDNKLIKMILDKFNLK